MKETRRNKRTNTKEEVRQLNKLKYLGIVFICLAVLLVFLLIGDY